MMSIHGAFIAGLIVGGGAGALSMALFSGGSGGKGNDEP